MSSDKVYIAQSTIPNAGRGVFARVDINKGEIIERCPIIEIPTDDQSSINETMLVTYIYYMGKNKSRLILALGFGSIYNHASLPNAVYKEMQKQKTIDFIAIQEIKKDHEITVNYNQGNKNDTRPLWFDVSLKRSKSIAVR